MSLEPIIQNEVSQKEKDKYCILTHAYGIQKNGTEEFLCRAAIEKHVENRLMDMGRGEERVRYMERVTWTLTLPYVKQIANRICCRAEETQTGTLYQLRGWDGAGDGKEVQKGRDICIPMADSC